MKTVNLLPQWYLAAQREKRSLRIRLFLMLALGVVMSAWTLAGQAALRQLAAQRDDLVRRAGLSCNLSSDIAAKENEIRRLENLQLAYRDVGNPVPMSAVLQQVLNDMNPGMALSRVTIDVRNEPLKAAPGTPQNEIRFHAVARLTVVGIAPNDVLIAQLIGKLSANPLFNDTSLTYARTEMLRECSVRRFEIQLAVDLDRLASENAPQLQQASTGESHHAG